MNAKTGSCVLRDPRCREALLATLREFDGDRYCMDGFVVMPNHVHVLILLLPGWSLTEITSTWKKFSARKINEVSGLEGQLWLEETHDHIVRDVYELNVYRRYIGENPVKARLREEEYELGCGIGIQT